MEVYTPDFETGGTECDGVGSVQTLRTELLFLQFLQARQDCSLGASVHRCGAAAGYAGSQSCSPSHPLRFYQS